MIEIHALNRYAFVVDPQGRYGTHQTVQEAVDALVEIRPTILRSKKETCHILVLPGAYDDKLRLDYG